MAVFDATIRGFFDRAEGGYDVLEKLDLKVVSDPTTLEGATRATTRAQFRVWPESPEAKAEQGSGNVEPDRAQWIGGSCPRYLFCLHVDANSLDSVINRAPQPPMDDMDCIGYVSLVEADWPVFVPEGWAQPGDNEIPDDGEQPVEGCKAEEVGWTNMALDMLIPEYYVRLQNPHIFYVSYVRPPAIYTPGHPFR